MEDERKKVCLFGSSHDEACEAFGDAVFELGHAIGTSGADLVFGGCGTGLMGKAAAGARSGGAKVYGVITDFIDEFQHAYECDDLVKTTNLAERKAIMIEKADSFVVVPGGLGTWDEYYEIMTLKMLGRLDKPIALYNLNGYYDDAIAMTRKGIEEKLITSDCADICREFTSLDGLLEYLV